MKKAFFIIFTMFISYNINAQYYNTAIGLKLGWGIGIDAKHFLGENSDHAIEACLDIQKDGFVLSTFYDYHLEAFKVDGLRWYFGLGPYLGVWGENQWNKTLKEKLFVMGAVGVMGIEYTLENFPINFALDLQPRFNFVGTTQIWATGGITVRYTFKPKEEEEI